jgi:transcription antitermination factor NusG
LFNAVPIWVAVQVVPGYEKRTARSIEHKGYELFLPTCKTQRKWSDRIKTVDAPFFPGYLFCRISTHGTFGLVVATPGVVRIVSVGGNPCPVSEEEIETLRRVVCAQVEVLAEPYLAVGKKIRICEGPFCGVVGVITQVKNRARLVISIDAIMRSISIEVGTAEVAQPAI